jgi:hypothetical protein
VARLKRDVRLNVDEKNLFARYYAELTQSVARVDRFAGEA